MPQLLRIQLLGEFLVLHGEMPVASLDTARLQSLLAYLVLHREAPRSRSHLAFLFWPDSTESQARTNLRKQIYYLRRTLPDADSFLHVDSKSIQWLPDAPFSLDVADFEEALAQTQQAGQGSASAEPVALRHSLEQAVILYRGELLPGLYDDWVLAEQQRLRQNFIDALERLILLLEEHRDYPAAINQARRLLRHDPLHEATYRRLMRFHASNGDRASALRIYHTCATVLERELDVPPGPEMQEAYLALLELEARPVPTRERLTATSPLVGREPEWSRLQTAWRAAVRGRPQLVLVSGEAGIGKTRLAEEMLDWAAHQGTPTASARCYPSEGELAYAPVSAWLRTEALQPAVSSLESVWLSEVARLLPEILAEQSGIVPPGPLTENWQRQRMFEALTQAFQAPHHLLLMLDDVQWCDRETIEWLSYLLRPQSSPGSRKGQPVHLMVIATVRSEEMPEDESWALLLTDLRRRQQLAQLELGPLDEAEAASLAAHVAGRALGAGLVEDLYRETEGNPLFVIETVRAGLTAWERDPATWASRPKSHPWPLPAAVQEAISARLERLSPAARDLVGVAATVGRAFTFDVLLHACRLQEGELVVGLDELWQRRIVREQGIDAYDFGHDKIREVAYAELSAARRRILHRQVARALEEVHAVELDPVSGQIAAHFEQGSLPEQAVPYYRRAAAVAQGLHANKEAIGYCHHLLESALGQHLSLAGRGETMLDLAQIRRLTGAWSKAEELCRQALTLVDSTGDLQFRARCQRALGDNLRLQGAYDEALRWLERAGDDYLAAGDRQGLVRLFWTMGEIYWYQGHHARALAALENQMRIAGEIGDRRGMCDAAGTLGIVYWSQGDFERSRTCCERSIEIAEEIDHPWALGRAAITMGNVSTSELEHVQAFDWYQQAFKIASQIGDRQCIEWAITGIGNLYLAEGDFPRALTCVEYGLHNALETGDNWSASIALANMAEIQAELGHLDQAEMLYLKALALGRPFQVNGLHNALYRFARFLARQQRYLEARSVNDEALALAVRAGKQRMGSMDVLSSARALSVRLRYRLGSIDLITAISELEQMLASSQERAQQAMVCYEIWRLDPAQAGHRRQAADLYRDLCTGAADIEYSRPFEALTGQTLPAPPPLPHLPPRVRDSQVNPAELLAQVDQVISGFPPDRV